MVLCYGGDVDDIGTGIVPDLTGNSVFAGGEVGEPELLVAMVSRILVVTAKVDTCWLSKSRQAGVVAEQTVNYSTPPL